MKRVSIFHFYCYELVFVSCLHALLVRMRRSPSYNQRLQTGYEHQVVTVSTYTNKSPYLQTKYLFGPSSLSFQTRIGTLHEDRSTFMIISRPVLFRRRNVAYKSCRENKNAHLMFSNIFSRKSCCL